jgi:hypothetical protein
MATTNKVRVNVDDLANYLNTHFPTHTVEQMTGHITTHADSIKSKRGRKPGSANKKKKAKDPNAPKRPLSAYMEFLGHHRPLVKAAQPDIKNTELVSKIAADWNLLDDKTEWEAKAAANKIAYGTLKDDYLANKSDDPSPPPTPNKSTPNKSTPNKSTKSNKPTPVSDTTLTELDIDGTMWWIDFNVSPNKIYATNDSTSVMKGVFMDGAPQFFS